MCEKLGAERVILYKEEDFASVVRALTAEKGVDLILDMVGGPYFARNLEALSMKGRLVQIATLLGANVSLDLRTIMVKRLVVTGSTLRSRSMEEKSRLGRALENEIWPSLNRAKITPVIYKTFPLERAGEAHALMESGTDIGKIVLTVK